MEYAEKSLAYGLETGDPQNIMNAYQYLSSAYEGVGNYAKALDYHKSYSDLNDTIFNTEKYKSIKEMEMKFETEKKEQQVALLSEKNKIQELQLSKRKRIIVASAVIFVLSILLGYIILRNSRLRARHKSLELEQRLFRSQMNPHFIFNSLIAIQSYIYSKEPVIAGDFLAKFADLIRITLENSRTEFVLLEKELKMLEIYLELQKLRFSNVFSYKVVIGNDIEPSLMLVPPMLAQPFIENAIEHGLRHKEGEGFLSVNFCRENNHILFSVEDNGIGREKARKLEINKKHQSMATSITRERLEVLGRKLNQKFDLNLIDLKDDQGKASGTKVKFTMPYKSTQ